MTHYLVLDVETSGLFRYVDEQGRPLRADAPGQPRLAQIGMIFVDDNLEIQNEYEFLIKPRGWMMSKEATETTGITNEHLAEHGVDITEALKLYNSAIELRRVIVGFNVQFDLKVGRAELRHAGMQDNYLQTRHICLMHASRPMVGAVNAKGHSKTPSLEEACKYFEIDQPKAHSALADARSTLQIMQRMWERGALPEPKSPYDKKPKKAKKPRASGVRDEEPEEDAQQEIPLG